MKPPLGHLRENRIADPTVQDGHRSGHYLATAGRQPASLYQVVAFTQFFQESGNLQKVIATVGIAHDDEFTPRGSDTSHQSTAISFRRNMDQARAQLDRDLSRAI